MLECVFVKVNILAHKHSDHRRVSANANAAALRLVAKMRRILFAATKCEEINVKNIEVADFLKLHQHRDLRTSPLS